MADYIESLAVLAEQFGRLQGVGRKSAMRMAFSVLDFTSLWLDDYRHLSPIIHHAVQLFLMQVQVRDIIPITSSVP